MRYTSIYPTLCELAGLRPPDHIEGFSIVPLLKDPKSTRETPAITTQGFKNHTVRSEDWRYIRYADGSEELYDEVGDPLEYKNLADDPRHSAQKAELAKWLPSTNAADLPSKSTGGKTRKGRKAAGR